jgi:hypothetical protein
MSDKTADFVCREHESMKFKRANWETHWQQIAERILPDHAVFNRRYQYGGEQRNQKIFDASSALALQRHAAIMESLLTPHSTTWHKLKCPFPEINNRDDVQQYFASVNRILFSMRYSPSAMFIASTQSYYLAAGAFGTGCLFVTQETIKGNVSFRYVAVPLAELYIRTNFNNVPIAVVREFERTAAQIVREFGNRAGSTIPAEITRAVEKDPSRKYTILHYVGPADESPSRVRDFDYTSYYVIKDITQTLSKGGYYSFPYVVGRYSTAPGEEYGRSPAMLVLPDIKMLNEMARTTIRAAHHRAEPPLLTLEDGSLSRISMKPNSINFGGLNEQGQQLVQPMQTGGDIGISLEMANQRRELINDAFFVTLFQILVETPRMTATEVIQRAQEKSSLLSPIMGRQQSELLGPTIDREIDMATRAGLLPEMPQALMDIGGVFAIEYDSPLTRLQESEEISGIMRTIETALPLMQIDPSISDNFDFDVMTRILSRGNGAPPEIMRAIEQVNEMRGQRAQQEQQQQQAMMMEPVSAAMKNTAQAQKFQAEARGL